MSWRDLLKKRTLIYGTGSAAAVALVLGILVVVALLASRYQFRWDLTKGQSQSLTAVTKTLLAEVKKPLTMTAFYPEGYGDRQNVKDLLSRYAYHNRLLSFQFVDPDREPLKAREAGYRFAGNVLLEYEGRRQMADQPDEQSITNALRKVLNPERKKVYFLAGHGERDIKDGQPGGFQVASKALQNEGYEVQSLNLLTQAEVPRDAAVVFVASPKKSLMANEIAALKAYLNGGGRVVVMLEAFQDGGLKDFLEGYGIAAGDGMILDRNQVSQALGISLVMPMVVDYGPSPIARDFKNVVTVYPLARPLDLKRDKTAAALVPLATTTATSWEKVGRDWMKEKKGDFDPAKDRKGPFTLAALAEIKVAPPAKEGADAQAGKLAEGKKAYLAVFGNVDFAANGYFNLFGNGDLLLNTANFLAAEEQQITVRQADRPQPLMLSPVQIWTLFFASMVAIPLVMLLGGIAAYRKRRARR